MKFNGEPYGLPMRGPASALLLTTSAVSIAIFVVALVSDELGSFEQVASALAIGCLVGAFVSVWEYRSAGNTLERRVEYARELDRKSRRDKVIMMLIIFTIAFVDAEFDYRVLVGLLGAVVVYTAYFLYDRWVTLPRIIAKGANQSVGGQQFHEASSAPDTKSELSGPEKDLRDRWIYLAIWVTIIAANLIAGVLSSRFTGGSTGDFGIGVFAGLVIGGIVMIAILGSGSTGTEDGRFYPSTVAALFIGAISIDDIFSDGPGPTSTTTLLIAGSFGLAATIIDRWVALPRELRGDPRSVMVITDGEQAGLVHRGHVVALWVMAILFSGVIVSIDALDSGIPEDALAIGIGAGLMLAAIACAVVAWDARGSYSERVSRTARVRSLPVLQRATPAIIGVVAIVALLLLTSPGIQAVAVAVLLAATTGLLATLVDRWMVTPRKMNADREVAFG